MKTQLLEDFDESGSAPSGRQPGGAGQPTAPRPENGGAGPAAPAPPPAKRAEPATLRPAEAAAEPDIATARTEPLRVRPPGFAPQPAVLTGGGDPDWLAAHLARDAALNERSEWSGRWTRRLAAWGAAGVLLALLAGGGLWLYQQSQVDGALVVVANTNPAPAGVTAPRLPTAAPDPPPAMAEVQKTVGVDEGAVGGSAGASTGAAAGESRETDARTVATVPMDAPVARPDITPPPKRQRSHARKHTKTAARAGDSDGEASYRLRREETLMQCRAHGYDERQCFQRGCEMTKFGFACKG